MAGRRDQIIASAAEAFAQQGVAATTVRQIADRVGMLSGSLYHHFENKEAIVEAIMRPYLDDLRDRYQAAVSQSDEPAVQLRGLVQASLETAAAHPHATEIYQNEVHYLRERLPFLNSVRQEVQAAWLDVINSGVAGEVFRSDVDARVFYRLMRDAVWLSVRWYRPTPEYPVTALAEHCTAVFLNGLASQPSPGSGTRPRRRSTSPAASRA